MKHTIDSQHPVEASEATANGAHRPFALLAQTYNELVNKLLIGTATTGEFLRREALIRSRAHRLLRSLAGGARQRLAMRSVVYLTRHIAQSSERDSQAEERRGAELSLLCGYDPSLVGAATLLVHHMGEAEELKHAFHEMESLLSTDLTTHELALHLAQRMRGANPGNRSLGSFGRTARLVAIRNVVQQAIGASVNPTICCRASETDG